MRFSTLWIAVLLVSATSVAAQSPVTVMLELGQEFFYAGKPLPVRVSIRNTGPEEVDNPFKKPLFKGFVARKEGTGIRMTPSGKPSTAEPAPPEKLVPRAFYGAEVDVSEVFPQLREPGIYHIHWEALGLQSSRLTVRIIPEYDPSKSYEARIHTADGPIVMHFFAEEAPIATKAFIDMANAGYYDGLIFQEVQRDGFVVAGAAEFGGADRRPFRFPADRTAVRLVAGTVVMKPVSATPPTNGPELITLLKPQPTWVGQVTALAQVVEGLSIVQRISRAPTREGGKRPQEDVRIQKVEILERQTGS